MKIYRYEDSLADIHKYPESTIFLAGPTVRGHQPHLTSWRFAAIEEFERQKFGGALIIPEFSAKAESDKGKYWIPKWEYAGLTGCDVIMFWIPRSRELIGLTTNHEHGYWISRCYEKVVYGRPDDSYRNDYLDLMWGIEGMKHDDSPSAIFNTLEATVSISIERAIKLYCFNREKSLIHVDSPYGEF